MHSGWLGGRVRAPDGRIACHCGPSERMDAGSGPLPTLPPEGWPAPDLAAAPIDGGVWGGEAKPAGRGWSGAPVLLPAGIGGHGEDVRVRDAGMATLAGRVRAMHGRRAFTDPHRRILVRMGHLHPGLVPGLPAGSA
jgi:hypothetical protein